MNHSEMIAEASRKVKREFGVNVNLLLSPEAQRGLIAVEVLRFISANGENAGYEKAARLADAFLQGT